MTDPLCEQQCCSRQPSSDSWTCTSLLDLWEFRVAPQTLGFAVLTCSAQGCVYSYKIAQESGAFKDAETASVDPGTNSGTNQRLEAALAGGPELRTDLTSSSCTPAACN